MPRGRSYQDQDYYQEAAGQHPCSRQPPELCDSARLTTDPADGTTRREPGLTPRAFCSPCETRIAGCLDALPAMYLMLGVKIGDPERTAGAAVRIPPGSRVLVNPEIDALMRQAAAVLAGWAARVRSVPGLQLAGPRHPYDTAAGVKEACATLAAHLTPLLALQPGWTSRTYTKPLDPDLEEALAGEEIIRAGEHHITVMRQLAGPDAGNDILRLHWRARKLLGWTKAPPETFDGIPCQNCEEYGLERAEPPSDPDIPADHSKCVVCGHTMTREVFDQWVDQWVAYSRGAGVQVCRRCSLDEPRHEDCAWDACACTQGEHPRRRAVA